MFLSLSFCFLILTGLLPFYAPIGFSVKSFNKIQKAYVYLIAGERALKEKKIEGALQSFQEGLKNWSYYTQLRVEVAKIY